MKEHPSATSNHDPEPAQPLTALRTTTPLDPTPSSPRLDGQQATIEHTEKEHATITHARFILFLILLISFLYATFIQNLVLGQIITGLFALLSIGIFDQIFTKIDIIEPLLRRMKALLTGTFVKPLPTHIKKRMDRVKGYDRPLLVILLAIAILTPILYNPVSSYVSGVNDAICLRTIIPWPACNPGIGVTTLRNGVRIGLITNDSFGPFDQSERNSEETQVEADIFQDNSVACTHSHITLAIVTMLSRTVEDPSGSATIGLNDMRGAFLAQHDYNVAHSSFKVCLVIANLGTVATTSTACPGCYALPQVIKQLVQFAHHDPTFRGIVGFPYSQQTSDALKIFKSWQQTSIPIVSPTATSDQLSNIPNFYRVASSDQRQSEAMVQLFCNRLSKSTNAGIIDIFTDATDAYSSSLSYNFTKNLSCANGVTHESYQIGNTASIQSAINNAVQKHATFIFFPGYTSDLDTLEEQLQIDLQGPYSSMIVLGGDGLYDIVGITHNTFASVYTTTYASPLLNTDPFVREYTLRKFPFPYLTHSVPSYTLLAEDSILTYDATNVYTQTLDNLQGKSFAQDDFNTVLASVSFQGISGYLAFQGLNATSRTISDPLDKPVYIMCTDHSHALHWIATYDNNNKIILEPNQSLCT